MIAFIGIFLALVVVLPLLTKKRTQCSILCPFGAMQSLLDRISPFRVAINTKACVSCGACDRACPMLAMNPATRAKGRRRIVVREMRNLLRRLPGKGPSDTNSAWASAPRRRRETPLRKARPLRWARPLR